MLFVSAEWLSQVELGTVRIGMDPYQETVLKLVHARVIYLSTVVFLRIEK